MEGYYLGVLVISQSGKKVGVAILDGLNGKVNQVIVNARAAGTLDTGGSKDSGFDIVHVEDGKELRFCIRIFWQVDIKIE